MRYITLLLPLVAAMLAPTTILADESQQITVLVDPRVELMSIIFRLAGNPEYNQAPPCAYVTDVEAHFGKFKNHDAVQAAQQLRRQHGVSYDAVMSMALHLTDAVELNERVPLDLPPAKLDGRWQAGDARDFLKKARQFVVDTKYQEFIDAHQTLYRESAIALSAELSRRDYVKWFDEFFGERPSAKFFAIVGMLNGPGNYGPSVVLPDGTEEIYMVIGMSRVTAQGTPSYDRGLIGLVVHEYCHSYVNDVVDKHMDELAAAGQKIFPHVEQAMQRQAYGDWRTVMRESCVRACTVRYHLATEGEQAAREAIDYEHGRSFLWTGELADLLGEYEADRQRYPTFDSFFPRIIEFFNEYAERNASGEKLVTTDVYGPINRALNIVQSTSESAVVWPDSIEDRDLQYRTRNFVKAIHQQFYVKHGVDLIPAKQARKKNRQTQPLVIYGSPDSNALLADVLTKCNIEVNKKHIKIQDKEFKGRDLILITCYPNPYNPDVPVLIYASANDKNIININDFFHGPTDYLIGRWAGRKAKILHQGNYHRMPDGKWVIPE